MALLEAVGSLAALNDEALAQLESSKSRQDKRLHIINSAFFYYFQKTVRPLVCARIGNGKIRVLGRSLVNKTETTGLELIQATRNSPLLTEVGAGLSIVQTIFGIPHKLEMQKLELEEKKLQIEEKKLQIEEKKIDIALKRSLVDKTDQEAQKLALESYKLAADIKNDIVDAATESDLLAINHVRSSFTKFQLEKAYQLENQRTRGLLDSRGLVLDVDSVRVIDEKA